MAILNLSIRRIDINCLFCDILCYRIYIFLSNFGIYVIAKNSYTKQNRELYLRVAYLHANRRIYSTLFFPRMEMSIHSNDAAFPPNISSRVFRNTYSFRFDLDRGAWYRRYEPSDVVRSPMACEKEICPAFHIRARLWPHKNSRGLQNRNLQSSVLGENGIFAYYLRHRRLCRSAESRLSHSVMILVDDTQNIL